MSTLRRLLSLLLADSRCIHNQSHRYGHVRFRSFKRAMATNTPGSPSVDEQTKQKAESAKAVSSWLMFPWERRQMDGAGIPLHTWEKIYWWVFVGGMAALLFSWTRRTPAKEEKVDEDLEARKQEMARAVLAGKSLTSADVDPFEGYTPRQIERFVQESTGASTDDPYEGMSPEEIDEYVSKHGN